MEQLPVGRRETASCRTSAVVVESRRRSMPMQAPRASRTAQALAFFRALESTVPRSEGRFRDPYAEVFLPLSLRAVLLAARYPPIRRAIEDYVDRGWPGARTSGVARSSFVDAAVQAALRSGIEQVVLLGAGFDSRPYRIAGLASARVYEVDHPLVSAFKRRILLKRLGALPRYVRYVALDFHRGSLDAAMRATDFRPDERTLFLWESVTHEMSAEAVDVMLRWCACAAPTSLVIFAYIHRQVLETPAQFPGTDRLIETLAKADERWTFGFDPALLSDHLEARGIHLEGDVGSSEYRAQYYGRQAVPMRGYEFYRVAVGRVV